MSYRTTPSRHRDAIARRPLTRAAIGGAVAGAVLLLGAPSASAHVGVDKDEVEAGVSTTLTFSFGHGCDGSATNRLAFQIPEGVLNAQPLVHPGWDIEIERVPLAAPAEVGHGEEQTDRPGVITFTAQPGNEVPDELRDTFTLAFTAPDATGPLHFKVVQGCVEGENPWIEEFDGTGEEPDHPAPSVMVIAASGASNDHHEAGETTDTTADDAGHDDAAATHDESEDDGSDDDGGSDGLAIAALVVGGLGLVVGGAALARSRSSKPT
jgi:periplasmic copper chaperone A